MVALAALADAAAALVDVVVHVEEPVGDLVRELDVTEPLAVDATSFSLAQYPQYLTNSVVYLRFFQS